LDSIRFGITFGMAGSSMETWKTGWTEWRVSGSRSVKEWEPAWAMILKGPRYFSENFFVGRVDRKDWASTKACCPTLNSGARDQCLSAGPWYCCWPSAMRVRNSWWSSSRSVTKFFVRVEARSLSGWTEIFGWYPLFAKKGDTPVVAWGALL
jgi:hypothetical protein